MVLKTMKYMMAVKYRRALGCGRHPCGILSYLYQMVGPCLEVKLADLGLGWVVCGG